MILDHLAARTGGAAENMAVDFLLLQRYPGAANARFRHYGWREPSFTFGYSQKWDFVRTQLPEGHFDVCRRVTGGGIVDHRDDWTFTLVIPRGHALEEMRAVDSYREVHLALASALTSLGAKAEVKMACEPDPDAGCKPAGVCFTRAELYDVVDGLGAKIAGAAQKRSKTGLLFQGSIWRPAVREAIDWDLLEGAFVARLAVLLGWEAVPAPWPDWAEGEVDALTEQYQMPEWQEYR